MPEALTGEIVQDDQTPPPQDAPPDATPADAHPVGHAVELHRPQGSTQLIPAANAEERVAAATEVATQLDAVIRKQGMRTKVGSQKKLDPETGEPMRADGRDVWVPRWHVNVEGWQTLATLLGLAVVPQEPTPVCDPITGRPEKVSFEVKERVTKGQGDRRTVTERVYTVEGYSWRCRCEVYKDGVLIGAGESVCSRTEQRWKEADDYAVMGMAQTRATSRAIAAAARWIVTLAGYSATPAEEMPADAGETPPDATPAALPDWAQPCEPRNVDSARQAAVALIGEESGAAMIAALEKTCGGTLPALVPMLLRPLAKRLGSTGDASPPPAGATPEQAPLTPPDRPPSGSVPYPDLTNVADPAQKVRIMQGLGCICDRPIASIINAPIDTFKSDCPIQNHGIPF